MSSTRDPDLLIKAFLDEGMNELPDRSFDAVRTAVDETRQWAVVGPWKEPQIMTATRFALIAAAIAVVAVVAIRFLPSTNIGAAPIPTPSPVVTPSPTASPSAAPATLPSSGSLSARTYVQYDPTFTRVPLTFTVPAGWSVSDGFVSKGGTETNVWTSSAVFGAWIIDNVFGDACQWSDTLKPVTTAAQIVDELSKQAGRDVARPQSVTVGGMPATLLRLSNTGCNGAAVRNWPDPGPDLSGGWRSLPGQSDNVYVVDLPSGAQLIVTSEMATATDADKAELADIVKSIHFGEAP